MRGESSDSNVSKFALFLIDLLTALPPNRGLGFVVLDWIWISLAGDASFATFIMTSAAWRLLLFLVTFFVFVDRVALVLGFLVVLLGQDAEQQGGALYDGDGGVISVLIHFGGAPCTHIINRNESELST